MRKGFDNSLSTDGTFYFGNLVGDATANYAVTTSGTGDNGTNDLSAVSGNHLTSGASVTNPYDINRDGAVNASDDALVTASSLTTTLMTSAGGYIANYAFDADSVASANILATSSGRSAKGCDQSLMYSRGRTSPFTTEGGKSD